MESGLREDDTDANSCPDMATREPAARRATGYLHGFGQKERERLRRQAKQGWQKAVIHLIDADGKTGDISYLDSTRPPDQARIKITSARDAEKLIEEHKMKAGERELFYMFLFPRPVTGRPSLKQVRDYTAWFAKVPNSLQQ